MSSTSLLPIAEQHPNLRDATKRFDRWIQNHPGSFLDTRVMLRDLGDQLSSSEIVETFKAIREMQLGRVFYRVVDPEGNFTEGQYATLEDIPKTAFDEFDNEFEVLRENIVQVYELQ